ncbi:alpha/beta fold hydrolase [Tsukamurella soli]|uniref:Alpha/beta fold hydrolase n=1 Tax=Tsukamurella soli TaxID=644556 RepID=A0ABP8KIS5_9ACTN
MEHTTVRTVRADDGTRIAYRDEGAGEPVLLIPGLGYASWSWSPQLDRLGTGARVLAMDNRGTGESDAPPGPYTIGQMAEDALAVIRATGAPAHVVGSSMGGYIALTLALRHPGVVKSLTLIATTDGGPGCTPVPDSTLRVWTTSTALSPAEYARETMPVSFAPGWTVEHADEFEKLLEMRLRYPTSHRAWSAQFGACAEFLEGGAPDGDVDVPVLIVHGTADRVVPFDNVAHLARRLPGASQLVLPGAGHLCWLEEAGRVNHAIEAHMAAAG